MVHRKHQEGQLWVPRVEVLDQVQPVADLQGQIYDHHVGVALGEGRQRGARVAGFSADDEVRLLVDDLAQAVAEEGMIVHDQDFFPGGAGVGGGFHGVVSWGGAARGSRQFTVVPRCGALSIHKMAPIMRAR